MEQSRYITIRLTWPITDTTHISRSQHQHYMHKVANIISLSSKIESSWPWERFSIKQKNLVYENRELGSPRKNSVLSKPERETWIFDKAIKHLLSHRTIQICAYFLRDILIFSSNSKNVKFRIQKRPTQMMQESHSTAMQVNYLTILQGFVRVYKIFDF